jgi:flagellar motor switch/type III secretory pathway protein FliN
VSAAAATPGLSQAAAEKVQPAGDSLTQISRWGPVLDLPCQLSVDLPLPNFKVADFLALRTGSVIATNWRVAQDVPLRINGTLIGWGEFEGAGSRLAVRLTELA